MIKKILKYSISAIVVLIFIIIASILLVTKNTSQTESIEVVKKSLEPGQVSVHEEDDGSYTYSTDGEDFANYVDGDTSGAKSEWIKNGDIWKYTFYVDDPSAQWYIWEDSDSLMEGYTGDYTEYNTGTLFTEETLDSFTANENMTVSTNSNGKTVYTWLDTENSYKVIDNGDGTYTKITTKLSFTVTNYNINTENQVYYGDLTINKIVKDSDEKVLTENDDDTNFVFTVKLTTNDDSKAFIEGTKSYGDIIFKDGVGTVSLKAGGSITISDIPAGVSYSVTEKADSGYETSYDSNSGTIEKNENSIVNFTNTKKPKPEPGSDEEEKTVNITLAKKVTGNSEVEDSYNFEISLTNLKANATYSLSNEGSFTSDSNGIANISISLKNNESVVIKDIPVGSKYKVYEEAGKYISSYVITDSSNKGLINNSSSRNTKENTALSTSTETADEGENVTITFTNNKEITQNLKLAKVVTDKNDKNSYIFTIEFGNMEKNSSFNSSVGKVTADSSGKAEITVYLAGGEEAEFYSVPVGTTYKITELASSAIASYTITDENITNNIVSANGANTKSKEALSTEVETVNEGEEATVTFTNDTVNQAPDSVSTTIGVTKEVLKMDGTKFEDCKDKFAFELEADNENNPMPTNTLAIVTGNGDASFGKIIFDKTGTYSYKITEKKGTLENYDYDETIYSVVYEVTNTEGLLEITKSVKINGFEGDAIIFTNKVVKTDVKVLKQDEYNNSLEGATLQILDSNKNVVDEWVTNGQEYVKKLAPGEYTLHEVKAPYGYYKVEDLGFTVAEDGKILVDSKPVEKLIVTDNLVKGQITLTKTGEVLSEVTLKDKALGDALYVINYVTGKLQDAIFELYAKEDITVNGKVVYKANEKIAEKTTGVDGIAIFDDLYLGKYYVVETNAPQGFDPIKKEIDLILSSENDEEKVVFIEQEVNNDRIKLDLSVTKNEKGNIDQKVKDAIYGVYNEEKIGNVPENTLLSDAKTNEDGYAKFDIDLPRGKYYVKEIEAPEGYILSTEVQEVDFKETKEVNLVFEDDYTKVTIKKTDTATGKDVIGAKLQILDKEGNVVEAYNNEGTEKVKLEWITEAKVDEDGKQVVDKDGDPVAKAVTYTKLPIGNYTLHEETAPKGYETAKDIKFTVNKDGKVEVDGEVVEEVTMMDSKIKEEVNKVDNNKTEKPKVEEAVMAASRPKEEDNNKLNKIISTVTTGDAMIYAITTLAVASIVFIIVIVIINRVSKKEE